MDSCKHFILRAELHNRRKGAELQSCLFEREFHIKFLGKSRQDAIFYDPNLKMHFENPSAIAYRYEIEINNTTTLCGGELDKSADFIRRINYMYDWIQLKVSLSGNITAIENKEELKNQWKKIKSTLIKDYEGEAVDACLQKIDQRFAGEKKVWTEIYHYVNFGLLFPPIPHKHNSRWSQTRLIEFSEYEEESFEEQIIYEKTEKGLRHYRVIIQAREGSTTVLQQYAGQIIMAENSLLPVKTNIETVFHKEGIANQWYFHIETY